MQKHLITVLLSNKSGVLTRVTSLFARRGYNIDSLSVCNTEDARFSRMTAVVTADELTLKQIIKQLDKLLDVIKITELDPAKGVLRELLLVKIQTQPTQVPEIESMCKVYKAKIIDLSPSSVIIELTGDTGKLDAFVELVSPYGIIELTRTGTIALQRGKDNIHDLSDYNDEV